MKQTLLKILVLIATSVAACSCSQQDNIIKLHGKAQGTYYSILYTDTKERNLKASIDSLLDAFDQEVSLWVDSSLIRKINDNSDSVISPIFCDILKKSMQMNDYTMGAFDCRIGRIVQAWGFSFKTQEIPDEKVLSDLLKASQATIEVLYDRNGNPVIHKSHPETHLDFNAIAQGYASDLVGHFLETKGIRNYLVDIGGEVVAKGTKPDGTFWKVGIEEPAATRDSAPKTALAIHLHNCAIVTSGSYRKYYEKDGVRYSHTIDPATGKPVTHSLLSVSVIDSTAWRADALATAFMVMGLDKSLHFLAENDSTLPVLFIYDDHGTLEQVATAAFEKFTIQ